MNAIARALFAGVAGAVTTNLLHEATRRVVDVAPRVDILGMQALAKSLTQAQISPPTGKRLYRTTLLADLASNTLYFALTGFATGSRAVAAGSTIGIAAGAGAVVLPKPLGLAPQTTNRTPLTAAITVALYGLGGLAAGYTQYRLTRDASGVAGSGDAVPDIPTYASGLQTDAPSVNEESLAERDGLQMHASTDGAEMSATNTDQLLAQTGGPQMYAGADGEHRDAVNRDELLLAETGEPHMSAPNGDTDASVPDGDAHVHGATMPADGGAGADAAYIRPQ